MRNCPEEIANVLLISGSQDKLSWRIFILAKTLERIVSCALYRVSYRIVGAAYRFSPTANTVNISITRSRTRQNFELVHIIGPVQNFGPPARNFGPLRAEFAWREWWKTLGGHVANWAGLSVFSPRENKISHTFFIDCIDKYSKVLRSP